MLKKIISLLSILFLIGVSYSQQDSVSSGDSVKTYKTVGFKTLTILIESDTSTSSFLDTAFIYVRINSKDYKLGALNLVGKIDQTCLTSQGSDGGSFYVMLPNVDIGEIKIRLANQFYIAGRKLKYRIILQK